MSDVSWPVAISFFVVDMAAIPLARAMTEATRPVVMARPQFVLKRLSSRSILYTSSMPTRMVTAAPPSSTMRSDGARAAVTLRWTSGPRAFRRGSRTTARKMAEPAQMTPASMCSTRITTISMSISHRLLWQILADAGSDGPHQAKTRR